MCVFVYAGVAVGNGIGAFRRGSGLGRVECGRGPVCGRAIPSLFLFLVFCVWLLVFFFVKTENSAQSFGGAEIINFFETFEQRNEKTERKKKKNAPRPTHTHTHALAHARGPTDAHTLADALLRRLVFFFFLTHGTGRNPSSVALVFSSFGSKLSYLKNRRHGLFFYFSFSFSFSDLSMTQKQF